MAIRQHIHTHDGPGGPFESTAVYDSEAGVQPGILLFPNFLGVKQWDFDKAEELADEVEAEGAARWQLESLLGALQGSVALVTDAEQRGHLQRVVDRLTALTR